MAAILALASHLPATVRTIEDIIEIVNERHGGVQHQYAPDGSIKKTVTPTRAAIMKFMGVEERRIAGKGESNASLGYHAAQKALAHAGYAGPIDGTICTTVATGTYPSNAARLHRALHGKKHCYAIDMTTPRTDPAGHATTLARELQAQRGGTYLVVREDAATLLGECNDATTASTDAEALNKLLARRGLTGADLNGIIVERRGATVAEQIEELLGIRTRTRFDLHAACAGFGYGLDAASALLQRHPYLVVSSETLSRETDYSDANSPLFGDGAGAALVGNGEGLQLLASDYGILSEHADLIFRDKDGWLRMPDGHAVFKHAVREMSAAVHNIMERVGWAVSDVDLLVAHQANIRILHQVASKTGIPPENVAITINRYGNMSSPTCPITLYDAVLDGRIHEGSNVVQVAFGSGLVSSVTAFVATKDFLR